MSLQLTKDDEGKKFVCRDGSIAEVELFAPRFDAYPVGARKRDGGFYWHTKEGNVWAGIEGPSDLMYPYREAIYHPTPETLPPEPAPLQNVLRSLPSDAEARKAAPIITGCLDYFPLALAEIARISKAGNDQHNPGQPLHWARHKSTDHVDCVGRHLVERGTFDTDGSRHTAKAAWRALALLQEELEEAAGWKPAPETQEGQHGATA